MTPVRPVPDFLEEGEGDPDFPAAAAAALPLSAVRCPPSSQAIPTRFRCPPSEASPSAPPSSSRPAKEMSGKSQIFFTSGRIEGLVAVVVPPSL